MVWLIILVALGFILGSIMTLKYTANMKMKAPKEIEHQYNKAFNLDAGEHAKPLADHDDDEQKEYHNEYQNEYGKNPMPDDEVRKDQDQNK